MSSSTIRYKIIALGAAYGVALQAILLLAEVFGGRSAFGTLLYTLLGIAAIVAISFSIKSTRPFWLSGLFALLFAWPVAYFVYLVPVAWLAFLLKIVVTAFAVLLAHRLFASWRASTLAKIIISTALFAVWYLLLALPYLYLVRRINTAFYFN